MASAQNKLTVVVPAAGVGKRMKAYCPKQYLKINNKTVLEHTIERLLSHEQIDNVIIALGEDDEYFFETSLTTHKNVSRVIGGKERVDSVLSGLNQVKEPWVLVHDAARPCITHHDLTHLIQYCYENDHGALLAAPVRDTMKQASVNGLVSKTLERSQMWHALTPQMYKTEELRFAINSAFEKNITITDESSAMEYSGFDSGLVEGSSDNIKITRPEDLALAQFILSQQTNTTDIGIVCE